MSARVDEAINALILREGDYSDHPADRGGPTRWGITEQVARANGYVGDMRQLPVEKARSIYLDRYWIEPGFDQVADKSVSVAEELFDTGVNMGVETASKFLQRCLNVLNRGATAYPDIRVDGHIGKMTLYALSQYARARGAQGMMVLLRMLNGLQSARYIEIAEANPSQESFEFGWQLNRVS